MEISNQARGYSYMLGVFKNRESGLFCNVCNSFRTTLTIVNEISINLNVNTVLK